jgi:hypothetical protein
MRLPGMRIQVARTGRPVRGGDGRPRIDDDLPDVEASESFSATRSARSSPRNAPLDISLSMLACISADGGTVRLTT